MRFFLEAPLILVFACDATKMLVCELTKCWLRLRVAFRIVSATVPGIEIEIGLVYNLPAAVSAHVLM